MQMWSSYFAGRSHKGNPLILFHILPDLNKIFGEMAIQSLGSIVMRDDNQIPVPAIPTTAYADKNFSGGSSIYRRTDRTCDVYAIISMKSLCFYAALNRTNIVISVIGTVCVVRGIILNYAFSWNNYL